MSTMITHRTRATKPTKPTKPTTTAAVPTSALPSPTTDPLPPEDGTYTAGMAVTKEIIELLGRKVKFNKVLLSDTININGDGMPVLSEEAAALLNKPACPPVWVVDHDGQRLEMYFSHCKPNAESSTFFALVRPLLRLLKSTPIAVVEAKEHEPKPYRDVEAVVRTVNHTLTEAFIKASLSFVVSKDGIMHACVVGARMPQAHKSKKGKKGKKLTIREMAAQSGVTRNGRAHLRRALRQRLLASVAGTMEHKADKCLIMAAECPVTGEPIGKCDPRVVAAMCWYIFGMELLMRADSTLLDSMSKHGLLTLADEADEGGAALSTIPDEGSTYRIFDPSPCLAKQHPTLMGVYMAKMLSSGCPWVEALTPA